jgi:hypothetical protein
MADEIRLRKIPKAVIVALQDLADSRGCSMEKVLQDAINTEVYINEQLENGCEIFCKDSDGKTRRVVFTHVE